MPQEQPQKRQKDKKNCVPKNNSKTKAEKLQNIFLFSDIFSKCKGDLLEVKDGNLKTHPALLENLVFLVEVCFPLPEILNFPSLYAGLI